MTEDEIARYWADEPPVDAETWARIARWPELRGYVTPDAVINGRTLDHLPHLIAGVELAAWRDQERITAASDRFSQGRTSPLYKVLGHLRGELWRLQQHKQEAA